MNNLRALRTKANVSVQTLAERLGVRTVTVYAWESGRNLIDSETGKRIVCALEDAGLAVTLDQLYARVPIDGEASEPTEARAA